MFKQAEAENKQKTICCHRLRVLLLLTDPSIPFATLQRKSLTKKYLLSN